MALIKCHECGKEISDKAKCCPNCGYGNKKISIKAIIFIIITITIFIIVWFGIKFVKSLSSNKYIGTYELVSSIEDYKQDFKGTLYHSNGTELSENYDIGNIKTTLKLENIKDDKFSYLESNLLDEDFIYNTEHKYIVLKIAFYNRYNDNYDTYACFNLNNNYLTQINCKETNDLPYIENIGLKYKKVN